MPNAKVYICEHVNWRGTCTNIPYALGSGDCVALDGTASSIRPDSGVSCTFYKYVWPPFCPRVFAFALLGHYLAHGLVLVFMCLCGCG
jgi:hypothetical protein